MLEGRTQTIGCIALAGLLVVGGTLATGLLPSGALYQALAGATIVAGFAVLYFCFEGYERPE